MGRFCNTLVLLFIVAGCTAYPKKMAVLKRELAMDSSTAEYRVYGTNGKNRLLALEERGRLYQLQGKWRESARTYKEVMDYFIEYSEVKPELSAGDALKSAIASTYGNDMSKDYAPIAFEQMMVHTLDAFNRLALKEWDGFGVNVRNLETWRNETARTYNDTGTHSTDNIYSLYLIGLYHEAIGDRSNALKAYRDIERMQNGSATVEDVINHLSGTASSKEYTVKAGDSLGSIAYGNGISISRLKELNGLSDYKIRIGQKLRIPEAKVANATDGEVVLFVEDGFIPPKREHLSYRDIVIATIPTATPMYTAFDSLPCEDGLITATESGRKIAKTQVLCDLAPLAAKALSEMESEIARRQISRATVKTTTQGALSTAAVGAGAAGFIVLAASKDKHLAAILLGAAAVASIGSIAVGVYNRASEHADLRSWLLLPRQVQIARFRMSPGTHTLRLQQSGMYNDVQVDVKAGKISIVHCITVPNIMRSFSACLDKIK